MERTTLIRDEAYKHRHRLAAISLMYHVRQHLIEAEDEVSGAHANLLIADLEAETNERLHASFPIVEFKGDRK